MRASAIIICLSVFFFFSCKTVEQVKVEPGEYIEQLSEGYLLVRLRNVDQRVQALRQRGQRTQANRLRNEQKFINSRVVRAFNEAL